MMWDAATSKWEPTTVAAETLNVFQGRCTRESVTLALSGGLSPLFADTTGYVTQNFGTAFTPLSTTTLQVNREGSYEVNIGAQGASNNLNLRLYVNGAVFIYGPRSQSNTTASINYVLQLAANDVIAVDNDIAATLNNVCMYIREVPTNKKIVNSTVSLGTSLELLSDTSITNKANGDALVFNSSTQKWENKAGGYTPQFFRIYTINNDSGVQPQSTGVTRNGVAQVYRIWGPSGYVAGTNMVFDNTYGSGSFLVVDSDYAL